KLSASRSITAKRCTERLALSGAVGAASRREGSRSVETQCKSLDGAGVEIQNPSVWVSNSYSPRRRTRVCIAALSNCQIYLHLLKCFLSTHLYNKIFTMSDNYILKRIHTYRQQILKENKETCLSPI
ncbi:MAG: hypothetical protein RMX98_010010, partial [Nostoc sp. DedQUE02]